MDRTQMLLKEFTRVQSDEQPGGPIVGELDDCEPETAATFSAVSHAMADQGFEFLHRRRDASHHDESVLVSLADDVIVGAIGPLAIMPDRAGARMLPRYFGVLPGYRATGHGRALWRAAARRGVGHHAYYQLLQARVGAASEHPFLSEGLRSLGFTATVAA